MIMKTNYFKKILLTSSLITASVCSYAQIIPDGIYVINNITLNEVMTVDQTAEADARMAPADIEGDDLFQQWSFVHQGNDIYNITNVGSGVLLGVRDRWCGVFGDVRAQEGSDDGFDLRVVTANTAGTFLIEIAYDNECNFNSVNDPIKAFDIQNGASGGEIQTFNKDLDNQNQQFEIRIPETAAVLSVNDLNLKKSATKIFYNSSIGLVVENNQNQAINLNIFDTSGRKVYSYLNSVNSNELILNIEELQPGVYFAQTSNELNQNEVTKIVID